MPTQQLIDIIIKATDQASATADKVDQKLKKFYNDVDKANEKAAKSTEKFDQSLINTGQSFQVLGGGAAQAANLLGQIKMNPQAGSSIDQARWKVNEMGVNVNSLKGKFMMLQEAVPIAFNRLKTSVSSAATSLKGKLASAIDSTRQKLAGLANGAKGLGGAFSALKGIGSMMVGMIGYDLFNGLVQSARASLNAASQVEYFGQRLSKMTGEAHLSNEEFKKFKLQLGDLQKEYRKVDMTAVGATAEEMAMKFKLPAKELGNLTEMTAIVSSAFVKEGSTQENAVLAVSDALDGQFRRLQEIGITQQTLIDNGWSGDIEDKTSLINAMNKSLDELGFADTAKDITNLDEAWTALTIAGGQLLQKVLVPLTPVIIQVIDALLKIADAVGPVIEAFSSAIANMPDWAKYAGLIVGFAAAVNYVATYISMTLVPALAEAALAALDFAIAMMANPLTWIAVALAAVAIAIYEVGKAFGWWTDVGSMIDAIWAGIQRLWSAFINHPDVQNFISSMVPVWNAVSSAIGQVVNWVMSFFSNASPGKFDIVRALIDALSLAWRATTLPIRLVITVIRLLWSTMQKVAINILRTITNIRAWWAALPGMIRTAISALVNIITQPFRNAYNNIVGVVNDIKSYVQGLTNLNLGSITDAITKPFRDAYQSVCDWVDKIKKKAQEAANNPLSVFGLGFDYEGMMQELQSTGNLNKEETIRLEQEINLVFDLKNIPAGTDEDVIYGMISQLANDKNFVKELTGNPDFQNADAKVKNRIIRRQSRMIGGGI